MVLPFPRSPWIWEHSLIKPFPKAKTVGKTYSFMFLRNERKYRRSLGESELRYEAYNWHEFCYFYGSPENREPNASGR